jgi:uncharacterized protein
VLKLNVLAVPEDPREYATDLPARDAGLEPDLAPLGPVHLAGQLYRLGAKVFFRGRASVRGELTCSRCLRQFAQDLEAPVDLMAVPAAEVPQPAPEDEEVAVAVVPYHGDQVDLAPEVRSALLLALPMKPLCSEDCPGLCPACGERRGAEGSCRCGQARPKGPFAVLERLRAQDPEDPGAAPGSQQEE